MSAIELPEGVSKEKFKSAINRLLNECFILKRCKDTQSDYFYIPYLVWVVE